jgi:hypothetical protein
MTKERVEEAEARRRFYGRRLPLFEQIAHVFLKTVASRHKSGELSTVPAYLDGAIKIDGASHKRRAVVLAIEELKQRTEAPLELQKEAGAQLGLLKLDPVPELKLYRDIATAILRIDAALRLMALDFQPRKPRFEASQVQASIEPIAKAAPSASSHRRKRRTPPARAESGALDAVGVHFPGQLQRARWRKGRRSPSFILQRRSHGDPATLSPA